MLGGGSSTADVSNEDPTMWDFHIAITFSEKYYGFRVYGVTDYS